MLSLLISYLQLVVTTIIAINLTYLTYEYMRCKYIINYYGRSLLNKITSQIKTTTNKYGRP